MYIKIQVLRNAMLVNDFKITLSNFTVEGKFLVGSAVNKFDCF